MAYTIEEVGKCSKKIIFNYEEIDLTPTINDKLKEKQKKVDFKGFRKGHVPLSIVEKYYRQEVESEALNSFINNELWNALDKEGMRVIGHPVLNNIEYKPAAEKGGKGPGGFEVIVDIMPLIELPDLSKMKFTREKIEVNDEDMEKIKKYYTEHRTRLFDIEDKSVPLVKDSYAAVNINGYEMDSRAEIPELKREKITIKLNSDYVAPDIEIPGLVEKLDGMKVGEKREFTFMWGGTEEDLASNKKKERKKGKSADNDANKSEDKSSKKEVLLTIELDSVKELRQPEFNLDFVKEMGFSSMEEFEEESKAGLIKAREQAQQEQLQQKIIDKIINDNPFDIPASMQAMQVEDMKKNMREQLKNQGDLSDEEIEAQIENDKDKTEQDASFVVRMMFLLDRLGHEFSIKVNEEDLNERYQQIADNMRGQGIPIPVEQIAQFYSKNTKSNDYRHLLQETHSLKVLRKLSEMVQIELVDAKAPEAPEAPEASEAPSKKASAANSSSKKAAAERNSEIEEAEVSTPAPAPKKKRSTQKESK